MTKSKKIIQLLLLQTVCLYLVSCATILNSPTTRITVHTFEDSKVTTNEDEVKTINNNASFLVPRSRNTLNMSVRNEYIDTTVQIIPVNSPAYHLNLFTISLYGVGYFIDLNDPRRWTYPANIFVHSDGTFTMGRINNFYRRNNISHLALNISLPFVNFFHFRPQSLPPKNHSGFFGISIGGELGYSNNNSIVLTFGGAIDYPVPVPVGISWDRYGVRERMFTHYLSLEHQVHVFRRLIVGTGISYNSTGWRRTDYGTGWNWQDSIIPEVITTSERHRTLGLSFSIYVPLDRQFRLGVNYRPSLYRIRPRPAWEYSHVISVDLLWSFRFGF